MIRVRVLEAPFMWAIIWAQGGDAWHMAVDLSDFIFIVTLCDFDVITVLGGRIGLSRGSYDLC